MKKSVLAVALAAAAVVVPATSAAAAQPVTCDGQLTDRVVGDVTIAFETNCTLTRVLVLGDVTAEIDAGDITFDRTTVAGDVSAQVLDAFTLRRSAIGGALSLSEPQEDVLITKSVVGEDATIFGAAGRVRLGDGDASSQERGNVFAGSVLIDTALQGGTVFGSAVGENLRIVNSFGPFALTRNAVLGAIDCEANATAPTGSRNTAGQKLGQCAGV
jgi:hypothetical protein